MVILQKAAICLFLLLALASAASSVPSWYEDTSIQTGIFLLYLRSCYLHHIFSATCNNHLFQDFTSLHKQQHEGYPRYLYKNSALRGVEQSTGPLVGFCPIIYSTSST